MDDLSLAHSRYNCTYHIVFIPKYRRKVMFGALRKEVGEILGRVCKMEEVTIIKAATLPDHVHMYVSNGVRHQGKNNTSDLVLWKSDDYSSTTTDENNVTTYNWLNDFEARYPDTDPPYEDPAQLQEFSTWMVSVDPGQATNAALPQPVVYNDVTYTSDTANYRKAKFRAELSRYVEVDSALFFYLFTELFLMVDNRAKNMFPSFIGTQMDL